MADTLNGNVKAFLWVIRHCEGTADPDGYRRHFGGDLFTSFADHPRVKKTYKLSKGGTLTSSAAGAYQFLEKTWDGLVKQYGKSTLPDFSPSSQDFGAVALIRGRDALRDVEEGRFEIALRKCNPEWASLPGSPYGQPTKTLAFCKQIYEQHGGVYMVAPLVVAAGAAVAKPFVQAAFEALVKELPTLTQLFGSDSKASNRNEKVIEATVNVVKETLGVATEQEAVVKVQTDADAKVAADTAIRTQALDLYGVDLSGVGEARAIDIKRTESNLPFWKSSPAFAVTLLLLPLLYMTVYLTLTGTTETGFTGEMKASTVAAVISGILGGAVGFWLGASFTTSRSRGLGATPTNG
ncbi:MAG: glycoside hydrolase family 104 protein [bacterium]|jgi:muramidase (phage lysozyme)